MIHTFVPTLEKPSDTSSAWYRNFHNSFYVSQLVNNVLLSYMDSFIEIVKLEEIIITNRQELINKGILSFDDRFDITYLDRPKAYNYDVEQGLKELVEKFRATAKEHHHMLHCMGVDIGGYMDREIDISLSELQSSIDAEDWYRVVKGFLNVWEFLFLFSITESTLKTIVGDYKYNTTDLISKIIKTNKKIEPEMCQNHNMNKPFMLSLWSLYTSLRNVYSHTHGVISIENKQSLIVKGSAFKNEFEKAFHQDIMLSTLMVDTQDIFDFENLSINKFYLIPDHELNIFRNFVSELMLVLDRLESEPG
ncbi:hypothetical protein DC887_RS13355, partial [Vibrio parahaemolyticus]|nr:hypothetical protein [Vibrio parahaemolyticus]